MNMESSDLFISYSHLDDPDFARSLASFLEEKGFRVWIDNSALGIGDDLYENIVKAICESGLYVAVISQGFCDENRWAFKEFEKAIVEENKRFEKGKQDRFIMPVLYKLTDLNDPAIQRNKILSTYLEGKLYSSVNPRKSGFIRSLFNRIANYDPPFDITEMDKIAYQIINSTGVIEDVFVKTSDKNKEISRFPVTNLEFQRFINEDGYSAKGVDKWWSEEGKEYWYAYAERRKHKYVRTVRTEDEPIDTNLTKSNLLYNRFNQPVTGVSYFETQAYCNWLGQDNRFLGKYIIRMPTQDEWMDALTNNGKTKFPWGNTSPNQDFLNLINERKNISNSLDLADLAKINIPSIYGEHPEGSNISGCHDLIGNVWEWLNDFAHDDEIDDKNNKGKIIGNCCFDSPSRIEYPPITYRYPGYRHHVIGFRLLKQKFQ